MYIIPKSGHICMLVLPLVQCSNNRILNSECVYRIDKKLGIKYKPVSCTVQLKSKLTLTCGEHACVLQFLSCLESKHLCDTKWAASESTFVYCMRAIFRVLHVSNYLCDAR